MNITFLGFGEAGAAIASGWALPVPPTQRAFDIKTDSADPAIQSGKWADYEKCAVTGAQTLAEALAETEVVLSLVTADQAKIAARNAAPHLPKGAWFFDCNSCSPGAKQDSAAVITAAGGHYLDVAIMAPIHPLGPRTPMLYAGPDAATATAVFDALGFQGKAAGPEVGAASATKMIRSVMVKGLEALICECVLAGRKAGVIDPILRSLDQTFPGFDWQNKAAYMLERVMVHGRRRAAEMREVTQTLQDLGFDGAMASATADWQQTIGDLALDAGADDYEQRADKILTALGKTAA
ncbi:MAG: DUF1932 domain-containing protein [Magnetospiraceae bacterium]